MKSHRKIQIAVFGSRIVRANKKKIYELAYAVGKEIALRGYVLISGGRTGVMEHSCKGCTEHGGISVGILPEGHFEDGNSYCTIKIPTGIGTARNYINARSGDGVIVIAGENGTLIESIIANDKGKPIVCFPISGGTARAIAGKKFSKNGIKIKAVKTPAQALDWLEKQIKKGK